MHKLQANLRAEVIRVLEAKRKASFGTASKYLKGSQLSTTVTRKVVENVDGRLCAEIVREFLEFYAMKHTTHVFVPEMSLDTGFARNRRELEREAGITDTDASKPLLLKLLE